MQTWNKRAVQGALIRLDQTGMIKRFRVRKNKTEDSWVICIQVLREPRPEDIENLGFKRTAAITDTTDELLHDDVDGDTFMRDLEVDMLDDGEENEPDHNLDEDVRIPPQWTPERLLSNVIFDFVTLGRVIGWDAIMLRNRVVGPFWRRPTESYLTRLADDWERTQPPHLRHLAIIRDTRNTDEKKFVHYVYRTYEHFQQAVVAGEAIWEAVTKPVKASNQPKKRVNNNFTIDTWGFPGLEQKDFVRFNGTATLSDVRSAIVSRKYGPRWDNALAEEIGYKKKETPVPKVKKLGRPKKSSNDENVRPKVNQKKDIQDPSTPMNDGDVDEEDEISPSPSKAKGSKATKAVKATKKGSGLTLTPEQRMGLGLKPTGRLSKEVAQQILAHRQETGDPTSLPDAIVEKPVVRNGHVPLLTKEERLAEGLSIKGRLGLARENEIREKRGLPKLVKKAKKKSTKNEPAVLTKQQRIALGFKGDGRLHQHFIEALRKEQENDIPLDESPAVEAYREFLKAEAAKEAARKAKKLVSNENSPAMEDVSRAPSVGQEVVPETPRADTDNLPSSPVMTSRKRKPSCAAASPSVSKKQRTLLGPQSQDILAASPHHGDPAIDADMPAEQPERSTSADVGAGSVTEQDHSTQKVVEGPKGTSLDQTPVQPVQPQSVEGGSSSDNTTVLGSPGVYVYASAKRKAARGRPRNAYIVVFKCARLGELPNFKPEANSGYEASKIVSMGALKAPLESTATQTEKDDDSAPSAHANVGSHLPTTAQFEVALESDQPLPISPRPSSKLEIERSQPGTPDSHWQDGGEPPHATRGSISTFTETHVGSSSPRPQQPLEIGPGTVSTETDQGLADSQQTPAFAHSALRPVAGWNTMSASAQVTKPSYQSPYAPRHHSTTSTPAPRLDDHTITGTAPVSTRETPGLEMNEPTATPQGVVGPIAEEPSVATPKKTKKSRGAGPSIAGTQRKLRRDIILEIIDRCGGVFPLHGEIWRPFSAIWDQRHGHSNLNKPGSTAVSDTLKEMIRDPSYGLKRMLFRVEARNSTGTKERAVVAKAGMTPYHPTVKRLAYGMANHALERSHQYYPKEVRDLFEYESSYVPLPDAPKDETVTLEQIYPKLQENKKRRAREIRLQKQREKAAAKKRNKQVERAVPKRQKKVQTEEVLNAPRERRTRLASLNDKKKQYRWAPLQVPGSDFVEAHEAAEVREPSPAGTDSSEDIPLMSLRPLISDIVDCGAEEDEDSSPSDIDEEEDVVEDAGAPAKDPFLALETVTFTHPVIMLHPTTGTFSTLFQVTSLPDELPSQNSAKTARQPSNASRGKKRVRIDSSASHRPGKRARTGIARREDRLDEEFVYSSVEDSDATSSEDEEEEEEVRPKQKSKKRRKVVNKRQLGKNLPTPTLLQRLTGLTGDPNDPIYKDPKQRQRPGHGQPWAEKKKKQVNKLKKERDYAEAFDHADEFKKLCLTLILASSMSGEDGVVNWSIIEKVYVRDKFLDLLKVKKLWKWMQTHMAVQLADLTNTLQSKILAAYEARKLPTIDDPEVYDWAGLVRWTMRTCTYSELPLPLYREALAQFGVDESQYATVDKVSWYGKKIADATRTHLQLQLAFVAPLHAKQSQGRTSKENVLKARSWTRANLATPQSVYDANQAHEKLKVLGEDILIRVVGDYVQEEHLRMRKLKRQLPGRNYTFTKKFAKMYKRPFELEDFMVATTVKKELDAAFANEDSENRFYSISRCEEDGSIMAIMSLVADGKVKLVPQLPPVNNDFGAPLPRLSKWGFCEGDYVHRAIDRNRFFWDTHVVPTSDYRFGSPLHPLAAPAADWPTLPEPPLAGKHDPDALLPIWSSIDGQTVTWPWWYRILNLVLQPLFLQPGATANDVFSHCPEHTTELFEVELVLGWLGSIGAVSKTIGGGYVATSNFWAAFGDKLLDTDDDWFGEHVKRKSKITVKQQWRDKYNLRYSAMQSRSTQDDDAGGGEQEQAGRKTRGGNTMSQRIAGNAKAQYRILQQALLEPVPEESEDATIETGGEVQTPAPAAEQNEQDFVPTTTVQEDTSHKSPPFQDANTPVREDAIGTLPTPETTNTPTQDQSQDHDVEMIDAGADADANMADVDADAEGEDEDAEGEIDDAMY